MQATDTPKITRAKWTAERKAARSEAMTGKRRNTDRSREFITDFLHTLLHTHSEIERTKEVEPYNVPNSELGLAFRISEAGQVIVDLSSTKLRAKFGTIALEIWRRLFKCIKRGGMSRVTGKAYESAWVLDNSARRKVIISCNGRLHKGSVTAEHVLSVIQDMPELCAYYTKNVQVIDEDTGLAKVVPVGRMRLVDSVEARRIKQEKRTLKQHAAAHNTQRRDEIKQRIMDGLIKQQGK